MICQSPSTLLRFIFVNVEGLLASHPFRNLLGQHVPPTQFAEMCSSSYSPLRTIGLVHAEFVCQCLGHTDHADRNCGLRHREAGHLTKRLQSTPRNPHLNLNGLGGERVHASQASSNYANRDGARGLGKMDEKVGVQGQIVEGGYSLRVQTHNFYGSTL